MDYTKNAGNLVLLVSLFSLVLMPLMAAAQPASGDALRTSFAKILNVPVSTMEGSNLIWFVLIPWALLFIIVYGILDEIKLFYKGGINFAIAFLATIMMIPTNVLGQIIMGVYGGGLSALAVIVGISILPRFIDQFGPRTGFPPVVLEILSALTYGFMMYYVFGFLTQSGGVLANYSWIRWVFTVGVPLLVVFRGYLAKHAPLKNQIGSDVAVFEAEKKADEDRKSSLIKALNDLATMTGDTVPGRKKTYSDATFDQGIKVVLRNGGNERGWSDGFLRGKTSGQIKELARQAASG